MSCSHSFTLAVASGKGGTGKTTVAVNVAVLLAERGWAVQYLDCDVEEPNGHLFLKPKLIRQRAAGIFVPAVDAARCTGCRRCVEACQFHALIVPKKTVMVFPELCHGCGGCMRVCPEGAIREEFRAVGAVECGMAGSLSFVQGRLNVGSTLAPPVIRAVKEEIGTSGFSILDAPPGTACPVVATVRDADFVLLVTEPTPFGLHDLELAVELMRSLERRFGVVVNRACGDETVQDYCREESIELLAEIPEERAVAECYSRGGLPLHEVPVFRTAMERLAERLDTIWGAAC